MKASRKLPAGAGKFLPVNCGNRRQSLPAETAGYRYVRKPQEIVTCGNCRQLLPAETAGNCYLWRFLPASAGKFACGTEYLQPSQVILHAPILQCMDQMEKSLKKLQLDPKSCSVLSAADTMECFLDSKFSRVY